MINQLLFFLIFFAAACNSQNSEGVAKVVKQPGSSSINWLINVKSTGRISSNHFSDFVVDKNGNSYISSFSKGEDSQDYIYIAKVSDSGEVLWELGQKSLGRATAISIDTNQNIWVVGLFLEQLQFDDKQLSATGSSNSFLAQFDENGKCLQLIKIPGDMFLHNCQVNRFNEILINGVFNGKLAIDGKTLNDSKGQQSFLAKFNSNGKCIWLESINTSGQVARIRSDSDGNFYLPGSFNTFLSFQGDTLFTSDNYDQNGFLIKIDRDGKKLWLKQFGNIGITEYGRRTGEVAFDVAFDSAENVIVAARFEYLDASAQAMLYSDKKITTIDLLKFDKNGKTLQSKTIVKSRSESQASALVSSNNGDLWLTGNSIGNIEFQDSSLNFQKLQCFIIKLDSAWKISELVLPKHGENTMFRAANVGKDNVIFSGHYQSNLKIDDKSISNDGRHGIFLFSRSKLKNEP